MIRSPETPSLIELFIAVVVFLLLIGAAFIGLPAIAEYVKQVPGV